MLGVVAKAHVAAAVELQSSVAEAGVDGADGERSLDGFPHSEEEPPSAPPTACPLSRLLPPALPKGATGDIPGVSSPDVPPDLTTFRLEHCIPN